MTVFSEKVDSAFEAYHEAFGESFPTEMHGGTFEEMADTARDCIRRGEPYAPQEAEDGWLLVY